MSGPPFHVFVMRFPLIHSGRRFFFFTFVVEGRRRVLSCLERGVKRPVLTEHGERIRRVWALLHQLDGHFTASDYVIMPDHVHLLLMVNSEGPFPFNPLVFAHWFMAVTTDGDLRSPIPRPTDWSGYFPPRQGIGGGAPVDGVPFVWSRDFWVDISFNSRQLSAIRRYIRMNPARYFWKLDNPDTFVRRGHFRHPILDPAFAWTACGDLTLLSSPFLFPVRLTMKKTPSELEGEIAGHIERVERGGIPVCGFLSAGEREFERRLKALPFSRWIKTVPYPLPERFDPAVEDSRYLASHRELILSSFTEADGEPFKVRRDLCLAMNQRTAAMVKAMEDA